MAIACLVLLVRTVSCFQWPSYVSGLYVEYSVVLCGKTDHASKRMFVLMFLEDLHSSLNITGSSDDIFII